MKKKPNMFFFRELAKAIEAANSSHFYEPVKKDK